MSKHCCSAQILKDYKDEQANISYMIVVCMIAQLGAKSMLLLKPNSSRLALFFKLTTFILIISIQTDRNALKTPESPVAFPSFVLINNTW